MALKKILVALDNSGQSDFAMEAAIAIGAAQKAEVSGCHVYAARLHETRFTDMETGLPSQYQSETALKHQREVHSELIEKGLSLIADSYLDRFMAKADEMGAQARRRTREGKNYVELINEVEEGGYDLVAMGALGKGAVGTSLIGGVAERVCRGIRKNLLVVKTEDFKNGMMVGIDGSPESYGALMTAIELQKAFGGRIEAVAVFDPYFHQTAFRNISGALSEEASKVFRFKEQEKLHDEIIDKGLEKLYQSHLDRAYEVAKQAGVEIKTSIFAGKSYDEILKAVRKDPPSFLVMGRFGLHKSNVASIGNTAENVMRLANTNVLITTEAFNPGMESKGQTAPMIWTKEAARRMERVPEFARGMAKKAIEDIAKQKGITEITEELVDEAKKRFGM